jgi:hypothetical protein
MAQDDGEIKMNLPGRQTINRSVSRDGKSRDIYNEAKLEEKVQEEVEVSTSRRELFNAVLPATGKVFTSILRSAQTTFSSLIEDTRLRKK